MEHEKFLKEALKLAKRGEGLVSPNPLVGALVVKGKQVIGRGWHQAYGLAHAEVEALKQAGAKAKGATLYVTLEPCCHYGKTPPCVQAIVDAGIKEVICCLQDPNPLVNGKGFEFLEKKGIKVRKGYLEKEATRLNEAYLIAVKHRRPYIILKWAMSLDGKIATCAGDSCWITTEETRHWVRSFRFTCDAILVGVNTIIRDDPFLDYQLPRFQTRRSLLERKRYTKVILDTRLQTPCCARIFSHSASRVIIFTSHLAPEEKVRQFTQANCSVFKVSSDREFLNLEEVCKYLWSEKIAIVLVEGGQKVLSCFWEKRLVDRVMIFVGNKFIAGTHSLSPLSVPDRENLNPAPFLEELSVKRFGDDLLIEGYPCFPE